MMPKTATLPECGETSVQIARENFHRLSEFVTRELGIKMPDSKMSMVQSRLLRRVRELGLQSIQQYCDYLFSSKEFGSERIHFIDAMTTNKTDFFRESRHFEVLMHKLLPAMEQSRWLSNTGGRLNVWSAACSSGEEPYTLAMVFSEYAIGRGSFDFQILATDVSTRVLQKARLGICPRPLIEPVPVPLRQKYLLVGKGGAQSLVRFKPAIRNHICFHSLNLMDDHYGVQDMFHVIFCRNVLIYFDRPTQESVINKLCLNLHNLVIYLLATRSRSPA